MVVYIKDRIIDEVIAVTYDVFVVYGNELIFTKQKAAKAIANSLSDSILFLVHRKQSTLSRIQQKLTNQL